MSVLVAFLLAAAAVPAAAAVDAEEAKVSERLAARALETLERVVGPGRAKVLIEVRGERVETHTEVEITSPLDRRFLGSAQRLSEEDVSGPDGPRSRIIDLPGYTKDGKPIPLFSEGRKDPALPGGLGDQDGEKDKKEDAASPIFTQKEHERSRRDGGFEVKSILATVVLDSSLDEALVREASQLLPQLLHLDTQRGDALTILRAPMKPAWRAAFATPEAVRSLAYAGGAALALLLAVLIAGSSFVNAARAFASELARRRDDGLPPPAGGEALPELVDGAPPGLLDAGGSAAAGTAETPLLGRRFDFLAHRDPEIVSYVLAGEKADDLSLVFGHLAESMPDQASRVFAYLPAELQSEVSARLLKLRTADPERLSEVEERLKRAVENGLQGPARLGTILSRVPVDTRADLLGRLSGGDSAAVSEVERHLFTIEDIDSLSPAELRRLIAAVPYEIWGYALRGVPSTTAERVIAELPEGPRELVRDAASAPQPKDKVLEARSRVLDARADLAAKGLLRMGSAEAGSDLL